MKSMESKEGRPFDFLKKISKPKIHLPKYDYRMYERMDTALEGVHERLEQIKRGYGPSYQAQNMMSDLSKAMIERSLEGDIDGEEMAFLHVDMADLSEGYSEVLEVVEERGNRFSKTMWQEHLEAELFRKIWPVIVEDDREVPELTPWSGFGGNIQAYLYGFLDLVSELGKAIAEYMYKKNMSPEDEMVVFERFITIADSIILRLSQERHFPGYVISNGYGHWMSYTHKLRGARGTVDHVRRDYNQFRRIYKMLNK